MRTLPLPGQNGFQPLCRYGLGSENGIQDFDILLFLKKNLPKYRWRPRFNGQLDLVGRVWKFEGITHCFCLPNPTLGGGGEARFATSGMLRYQQSGDTTWPRKKLH
jgi:hypothetical protein